MRARTDRSSYGSTSAPLVALFLPIILVIGLGAERAADPVSSGDPVLEEGDAADNPQSRSLSESVSIVEAAPNPVAPTVTGCPVTVLVSNGSSSTNERAPNANWLFGRSVYLITAAEASAKGLVSGMSPRAIGWRYATAPGAVATGTLIVYLQNTADTTNTKSTAWATAISGMTVVHNSASTTLPNTTAPFDITFTGGSVFTYTGGGLYVAFDWQWAGPTTGATDVACDTSLPNGSKGAQSNGSPPSSIVASSARPETRLTPSVPTVLNDASVDFVIALGSLAEPLVGPQTVKAVITNKGANNLNNLQVTLNITGAETFTDTKTLAALAACGGQTTFTIGDFIPSAIGSDTVMVSVPADDVAANNSKSRPLNETFNLYSYKHPGTTADGGVGLTGATGAFVAKFTTTAAAQVSAVNLEFFATSATNYKVAIYPDSPGSPGLTPLYLDAANRTVTVAGPVTITLPSPVVVGPGTFYAGIQQTNTTNASLSFDDEIPIRTGAFFLATPNPPTAWVDFAPGNDSKPNIGVTLVQCSTAAQCNDNNPCTDDACTNLLCVNASNNANSCSDGNACTPTDTCQSGTCVGHNPVVCAPPDQCHVAGTCNQGTGVCSNPSAPNGTPCSDSDACTQTDTCQSGTCHSGLPVICTALDQCHVAGTCDPATGCSNPAKSNGTACNDGNVCTQPDNCQSGACVGANPVVCTALDQCHVAGTCDPATGVCSNPEAPNGTVCTDGDACTAGDVCGPPFEEDFDGVTPPALPAGWTTALGGGSGYHWTTVSTSSDTAPNSAFVADGDLASLADERLVSPPIAIASPSATLSFRNRWSFSDFGHCNDAGVLEIKIGSGSFTDIVTAGGSFVSGGYTAFVGDTNNTLLGRPAWCGLSFGYPNYLTTLVRLPATAAGTTIKLQWRIGTALFSNAPGQNIDSIVITDPVIGCNSGPATDCSDNNPCTDDSCNPASGCLHANNANVCDDGNACTTGDACSGGSCSGTSLAPGEVSSVSASKSGATTVIAWSATAGATVYDMHRGRVRDRPVGSNPATETCVDNATGTTANDTGILAPGTGSWFLVRAENTCGNGSYGSQGSHGVPTVPRSSGTCP